MRSCEWGSHDEISAFIRRGTRDFAHAFSLYHVWMQQKGGRQTEILKLKDKISELKTSVEDFKGNFKQIEERISNV